jgi:hypothetical protein
MEIKESITAAIAVIIVTIVLLALTPTIVSQVDRVTTDAVAAGAGKWNFTGASGAISMLGLVPFVWVAAVLLAAVAGMWQIVKQHE